MNDLHIQGIRLIHVGLDSRGKDRSHEAEREYQEFEMKKYCSLTWLPLDNYIIRTCEQNYKYECQHH